jgi:hypothetical protein
MPVTVAKSSAAQRRGGNRSIAAARADGEDWTSIAYRHGISERQARRAAQDARQLATEEEDWRSRMSLKGGPPMADQKQTRLSPADRRALIG